MSILGIDLGTTNSLACVWKGKEAILIPNAFGSYLTPSVVSFLENGEVLVGEGAKQRLHTHPSLTFAEFTRCMGTGTASSVSAGFKRHGDSQAGGGCQCIPE